MQNNGELKVIFILLMYFKINTAFESHQIKEFCKLESIKDQ